MKQTIQCPKCKSVIIVPDVSTELVSGVETSVAIFRHQHAMKCPACMAYLTSAVVTVEVQVGWKLTEDPNASKIVLAGSGAVQ